MINTTKVASLAHATGDVDGLAHGHLGESKCSLRTYGTSGRDAYIFSVR